MKIFLASDHAAVDVKSELLKKLSSAFTKDEFIDLGTYNSESVHYPEFAKKLCKELLKNKGSEGILLCGTGIGVSIAANKFKGIRAALCTTVEEAKLAKEHNNANVLCMGARTRKIDEMVQLVKSWRETHFAGGRHQIRVEMVNQYGSDL